MWPFKKSSKTEDKGVEIEVRIDIPTQGMTQDAIKYECRKRVSLFITEALKKYASHGLTHSRSLLNLQGRGVVVFELPKSDRSIEISQGLCVLWDKFSGW